MGSFKKYSALTLTLLVATNGSLGLSEKDSASVTISARIPEKQEIKINKQKHMTITHKERHMFWKDPIPLNDNTFLLRAE